MYICIYVYIYIEIERPIDETADVTLAVSTRTL